jgi:hypothetical protein
VLNERNEELRKVEVRIGRAKPTVGGHLQSNTMKKVGTSRPAIGEAKSSHFNIS